jgi:hypothetical protein
MLRRTSSSQGGNGERQSGLQLLNSCTTRDVVDEHDAARVCRQEGGRDPCDAKAGRAWRTVTSKKVQIARSKLTLAAHAGQASEHVERRSQREALGKAER